MTNRNILILGNLVIDHNITESGKIISPGGSAFFIAKLLENLGEKTTVVSPYGRDFPREILKSTDFYPDLPTCPKTLIFRNEIQNNGGRKQFVENTGSGSFDLVGSLPSGLFNDKKIVFVAPLLRNLNASDLRKWKKQSLNSLFVFLPQGFFREVNVNGFVMPSEWKDPEGLIKLFDIIVVSDKDWKEMESLAATWSKSGRIVVVTREANGCWVYQNGSRSEFKAFKIDKIVDSTGAGDIFAGAFSLAFLKTGDIKGSAAFANAAAGISLRFYKTDIQYGYKEINKLGCLQGRSTII